MILCFCPSSAEYKCKKRKGARKIKFFAEREGKFLNFRKNVGRILAKRRGEPRFFIRLVSLFVCAVLICTVTMKIYRKAEPIALSALENVVGGWLEELVARAVKCELEEKDYTWDDFCTKVVNSDGSVASLNANTANISVMCADVVARINSEVRQKKHVKISVPIGSIIAPEYFSGKGFGVKVRAVPYVSVSAKINSEMHEAGINQTLHRISMTVVSDVQTICMSDSVTFRRESNILLAESVIVGKIPIVS